MRPSAMNCSKPRSVRTGLRASTVTWPWHTAMAPTPTQTDKHYGKMANWPGTVTATGWAVVKIGKIAVYPAYSLLDMKQSIKQVKMSSMTSKDENN